MNSLSHNGPTDAEVTVAIDTGGTFTDCVVRSGLEIVQHFKVPSTPAQPEMAILAALERLDHTGHFTCRHGTTVGTNGLIERRGGRVLLITNRGFEDILALKRQNRPQLYAMYPKAVAPLIEAADIIGCDIRRDFSGALIQQGDPWDNFVDQHLNALESVDAIAICFLHATTLPDDEAALAAAIKRRLPDTPTSCSAHLSALQNEYERASTTVINAYLQPLVSSYLGRLRDGLNESSLSIMSSAGGLLPTEKVEQAPIHTVLSGPAGGYLAAQAVGRRCGTAQILSLDMGGTSTDVSVITAKLHVTSNRNVHGLPIAVPMLPIEAVGAGGGSIAYVDEGGILRVGPRSAGAYPGPACYGHQREMTEWLPTVTDAHVVLGNITALLGGSFAISMDDARQSISVLAQRLNESIEHTADAIIETCTATMARACRRASVEQGFDPRELDIVAFGGAGGLHACRLADILEIDRVILPKRAGVLSAEGISKAPERRVVESAINLEESKWSDHTFARHLLRHGASQTDTIERFANCRLVGQDHPLAIPIHAEHTPKMLRDDFSNRFEALYGHRPDAETPIEVVSIRDIITTTESHADPLAKPIDEPSLMGPTSLASYDATLLIPAGWCARPQSSGDIICTRLKPRLLKTMSVALGLEIHRQRLMSIAEEMGQVLQKSALSANIRERRDFSCAIFDAQGQMIAHAAHIPVHLGATPMSVQAVIKSCVMEPQTDYILNDPFLGGTHLPDVTIVRPIFVGDLHAPVLYVVNRAHHADVGGITPGSLPVATAETHPNGLSIADEGICLSPQKLTDTVLDTFANASRLPRERRVDVAAQVAANAAAELTLSKWIGKMGFGAFEAMNTALLDYTTQITSDWIESFPVGSFHAHDALETDGLSMDPLPIHVSITRTNFGLHFDFTGSAPTSRSSLNAVAAITRSAVFYVLKLLIKNAPANDGMMRHVEITTPTNTIVDAASPAAVSAGNVETSQRIVDVLLLAFGTALVDTIPAQSCGSMNNVLFGGTDDRGAEAHPFVHYETLGGGSGAGPHGPGADAIHVHMTNTMNTPIEVLERRFPVRITRYAIRQTEPNQRSLYQGGRGIERHYHFLSSAVVTLIAERHTQAPQGANGGADGDPGQAFLRKADGATHSLPSKFTKVFQPGETLIVWTANGGDWGVLP